VAEPLIILRVTLVAESSIGMDRKYKATFFPAAPSARLRRRPLHARGADRSPSTPRRPATAARSSA
jgi:hypothetical protein